MEKVKMGNTEFSQLSVGFGHITEANMTTTEVKDFLLKLKELGIDTIDIAQMYGHFLHDAETVLGNVLRDFPELKKDFKIVTKTGIPRVDFWHYNQSYDFIIETCNESLKVLGIESIDLLLLHRPDVFADFDELYRAIKLLIDEGKVKQFGVSNFTPLEFDSLKTYFNKRGIEIVTNQIELNLFSDEHITNDNIFYLKGQEITPMLWSPVGAGKISNPNAGVVEIAEKYNLTPAALSYAYLNNIGIKPHMIMGSFKLERYYEALEGLNTKIEYKDMYKLLKTITGQDVR